MERRHFITALVAAPALGLLAACGSDATGDSLQTGGTTVDPPPVTAAAPSTEPTDAPPATAPEGDTPTAPISDAVVMSYATPGGFTTREFAFQQPPLLLLTEDGTLIEQGVVAAIFPGPMLQQHQVRTVSSAGIDALLSAAESAGLFGEVDYTSEDDLLIADASTATLTITADGATYVHEAYALGVGGGPGEGAVESTPERQALLDFLTALTNDPGSVIGAENLGDPTSYEPTAYQISVMSLAGGDVQSDATIVQWPADSGIDLAAAPECVEIERAAIGDLFEQADQLTFFEQDGETFQVTARPAYPGQSC